MGGVENVSKMYKKMGANFTKCELEIGSWKVGGRKWESNVWENGTTYYKVGVLESGSQMYVKMGVYFTKWE